MKVAHLKCVGLGMPVKGHMLWNCLDCGPHSLGALTDIVLELKQNSCIRNCPRRYQVAETRGHCTQT